MTITATATAARPVSHTLTTENTAAAWADKFSLLLHGQTGATMDRQSNTIGSPGDAYTEIDHEARSISTHIILAADPTATDPETEVVTRRVRVRTITTAHTWTGRTYRTTVSDDAVAEVEWYTTDAQRQAHGSAYCSVRWTGAHAHPEVAQAPVVRHSRSAMIAAHDAALAAHAQV